MIDLATASEVFCAGFSYSKSVTHPYLVGRRGSLLYMHDAPRKRDYRKVEFVAPELPCEEVLETVSAVRAELGEAANRWAVCAIQPASSVCLKTRDAYKSRGYRFMFTEPMMVSSTADVPVLECPAAVSRVGDQAAADRLAKAAGNKPRHFAPDLSRAYIAEIDGEPVGWVRSIETGEGMAWVAGMYVKAEFRRQGIAKALLSFMLRDDAEQGIHTSVLLASHTGALLYPALGYEQIGTLHLFTPRRD